MMNPVEFANKSLHVLVFEIFQPLYRVAYDETIHTDYCRKSYVHMLCNPECLDGIVVCLLAILRPKLYPSRVSRTHCV